MAWTVRNDLPTHTAAGNVCYICRSDPRRDARTGLLEPMLDPNIHIEFEGWLIVCSHCIIEAAGHLGMPTEHSRQRMQDEIEQLSDKLNDAHMRATLAEDALEAIRRYDLVKEVPVVVEPSAGSGVPALAFDADLAGEELDEGKRNSSVQRTRSSTRKW